MIFLIYIIILQIKSELIVFPIIIKDIPGEKNEKYIYTSFEMGFPIQKVDAEISFQNSTFYMSQENLSFTNSTFNILKSETFSIISSNMSITKSNDTYQGSDNFYFYTDIKLQNKKKFESIPILCPFGKNSSLSPIIGLQIENKNKSNNLINIFKSKNIIKNYFWTIKFNDINEGLIIIGDLSHDYIIQFANTYSIKNKIYWGFHISSIKFSGLTISDYMIGKIEPKILEIFGSYEYITSIEKLFFQNYIENNICRRIWDIIEGEDVFRFICEKDKFNKSDINDFPPLSIVNIEMNFTFVFNGEELFMEKDNKIIFLIVAKPGRTDGEWIIGRVFLLKYQFLFDNENNLIGIYRVTNDNNKKEININKNRNFYIILIIILIITLLALITVFIYMVYNNKGVFKSRRKRISELDDDFIYAPNEEK